MIDYENSKHDKDGGRRHCRIIARSPELMYIVHDWLCLWVWFSWFGLARDTIPSGRQDRRFGVLVDEGLALTAREQWMDGWRLAWL